MKEFHKLSLLSNNKIVSCKGFSRFGLEINVSLLKQFKIFIPLALRMLGHFHCFCMKVNFSLQKTNQLQDELSFNIKQLAYL